MRSLFLFLGSALLACGSGMPSAGPAMHPAGDEAGTTIATRFTPPQGATRKAPLPGSFAAYLAALPLKADGSPVLLFDGKEKARQDVHAAVIDVSVGAQDLQQCADAVMRLRAEHLYATGRGDEIAFDFTNGFRAEWKRWRGGERIAVRGDRCQWHVKARPKDTHEELLNFLTTVFTYAGTLSLANELVTAADSSLKAGDVFIQGGSPGHAVIVVDVAQAQDRTFFLLAQSYMPAQDIHVLRNPDGRGKDAWYELGKGAKLRTPEWTFAWSDRKRWP